MGSAMGSACARAAQTDCEVNDCVEWTLVRNLGSDHPTIWEEE